MQPPAQYSNLWPVGNSNTGYTLAPALPQQVSQQTAQPVPAQPRTEQECVLRHIGADSLLTNRGPLSPEELRFHTIVHLKGLQQGQAPPSWLTRVVEPIKACIVDYGGPPPASTGSTATTALPAAAPSTSPSGDVLRHPDVNCSVEELRWRDYQSLQQNQVPAGPTGVVALPGGLPQPAGAPPAPALSGLPSSVVPPNTPGFPTPVRTLFPPTPVAPGLAVEAVEGAMDTSDAPDAEQFFQCMYAAPGSSMASPEEMRVVQVESVKAGKQIVPYWLVSGA